MCGNASTGRRLIMTEYHREGVMSSTFKKKLVIVTTVPETLSSILKGQPHFLNKMYDVSLISSPEATDHRFSATEGVPFYGLSMQRGISPLSDIISIIKMFFLLRRLKPDAVHSYTPKAGLVSMIAGLLSGVPVRIHTFTGLIFPTQQGFKQKILVWVDRLICLCATKVVPEGQGVKNDLSDFDITSKPMEVIGYGNIAGVDFEYFDIEKSSAEGAMLSKGLGVDSDCFVFCYVGRLNKDKGVAELIAAFKKLPEAAHLIVVGGVDHSAPVDSQTLHELERHGRIHWLGHQDDVRPALSACDVLVLPSYREGFPNVVLQSGAMGKCTIATDINGCNEIIEEGRNGWLVPPRQVEPLAAAMLKVMNLSEARLGEIGEYAHHRIATRFDQKDHWQRMLKFYNEEFCREENI